MPAVTVDNPLTLPRVPEPNPALKDRPVVSITTAPRGFEGEGFPVRRAFAGVPAELVSSSIDTAPVAAPGKGLMAVGWLCVSTFISTWAISSRAP